MLPFLLGDYILFDQSFVCQFNLRWSDASWQLSSDSRDTFGFRCLNLTASARYLIFLHRPKVASSTPGSLYSLKNWSGGPVAAPASQLKIEPLLKNWLFIIALKL